MELVVITVFVLACSTAISILAFMIGLAPAQRGRRRTVEFVVLEWIIGAYAVLILLIIALAALVAIIPEPDQRKDAYKVLRLAINSVAGAGGILALLIKLHELGIL